GKSSDDGGDDKRLALVVGDIDTACARCVLVQHDRLQGTAKPGREQPMERDESRDQNGEAKKVISGLAFEGMLSSPNEPPVSHSSLRKIRWTMIEKPSVATPR